MTILSIDTSESHCSAAIVLEGGNSVFRMEDIGRGHAERLLPMIEELLEEAKQEYKDISRIAVVTGPGTFTGLRIGLSVARGLALSLSVPCIGLMSLPAVAASLGGSEAEVVHAVVKGRGGQVFYQAFHNKGLYTMPQAIAGPLNIDAEEAEAKILATPGALCGSGTFLLQNIDVSAEFVAVDPVVLANLCRDLKPEDYLPEPAYLRQADAAKAKAVFDVKSE